MIYRFKINELDLELLNFRKYIYTGSENYHIAQFDFTDVENWDNFKKIAVFTNKNKENPIGVLISEDGTCIIPWEAIAEPGVLDVGIKGVSLVDDATIWTKMKFPIEIRPSSKVENIDPTIPTEDISHQIFQELEGRGNNLELINDTISLKSNNKVLSSISIAEITNKLFQNDKNFKGFIPIRTLNDVDGYIKYHTAKTDWTDTKYGIGVVPNPIVFRNDVDTISSVGYDRPDAGSGDLGRTTTFKAKSIGDGQYFYQSTIKNSKELVLDYDFYSTDWYGYTQGCRIDLENIEVNGAVLTNIYSDYAKNTDRKTKIKDFDRKYRTYTCDDNTDSYQDYMKQEKGQIKTIYPTPLRLYLNTTSFTSPIEITFTLKYYRYSWPNWNENYTVLITHKVYVIEDEESYKEKTGGIYYLTKTTSNSIEKPAIKQHYGIPSSDQLFIVQDGCEYYGEDILKLNLGYSGNTFESTLFINTAPEGNIDIKLNVGSRIGDIPNFENGKSYMIKIKNKIAEIKEITHIN